MLAIENKKNVNKPNITFPTKLALRKNNNKHKCLDSIMPACAWLCLNTWPYGINTTVKIPSTNNYYSFIYNVGTGTRFKKVFESMHS